jgi:hypothetical protein
MTPFSQKLLAGFKIKLLLTTIGLYFLILACQANDEVISQELLIIGMVKKYADLPADSMPLRADTPVCPYQMPHGRDPLISLKLNGINVITLLLT